MMSVDLTNVDIIFTNDRDLFMYITRELELPAGHRFNIE